MTSVLSRGNNSTKDSAGTLAVPGGVRVSSFSFSPDGKLVYSSDDSENKIVWDVATGKQLANAVWKNIENDQRLSPDKRWLVTSLGNDVLLVDLEFKNTPREKGYRASKTRLKPWWHLKQAEAAEKSNDWFAETFHRAWALKADPDTENGAELLKAAYEKLKADYDAQKKDLDPYLQPVVREMLEQVGVTLDATEDAKLTVETD